DFTLAQLRTFDGSGPGPGPESRSGSDSGSQNPIYASLFHEVFDLSQARGVFGPGGVYHPIAGREATRALARLSFEQEDFDG
ncbi:hypothetical protein B484DRAFT_305170, partial [Ochromonadaceae sp. CCMP2298]